MDEVRRTKKALMTVGGVIVINLLLAILIPSMIFAIYGDLIEGFCLFGSIAVFLTALHPLFVIFAGVSILQARSEIRSTETTGVVAAILMFLSMFIIPITIGYGALLSPLILFTAIGVYLHSLLDTKQRFLLYSGMGILLLFYFCVFIIFLISDMFSESAIQATFLAASLLPLTTCTIYIISLYHSFNGLSEVTTPEIIPSPIVLESPSKQPQQGRPSILMPPPGWMADGRPLPRCRPGRELHKPPGWGLS